MLILSIGTFTLGVDGFVLSGLLPQVAASLHVSASTAGQLTTIFALVYAVGSPVIAAAAAAWDRRAAMWILVVLALLASAAVWLLPPARAPRLSLRERGQALADPRVLAILASTVTVLTPVFLVIAYLPAIMRTSGAWIVVAMLAYGAGQVTGNFVVPRLIRGRGARTALLYGACGITAVTAVLIASRTTDAAATATMAALGFCAGLTIVPQQHRIFAAVPKLAPVAVGLNGSGIYIATALGAAVGGAALAIGGSAAPAITAAVIGLLAVIVATTAVRRA